MDRITKLTAIVVFLISLMTYLITLAPTLSFWDCGEFIACSYIMGVPHPPGTPLYLMIGRFFSLFPFSNIAIRVNFISALSSALVITILFLIIVKLIKEWKGELKTVEDKIIVNSAGFIGALSYAFSDSFWFNAVEAEVYALSMLFTALVLYLAILWMDNYQDYKSVKFLLLIIYLFGLGSGVHLMNLLVIPTIFLLIIFTDRKLLLRYEIWSIVPLLVIIGFSTYLMILIRSGLNPRIDENNPENLENFLKYLSREQYSTTSQFAILFKRAAPFWSYQVKKMFLRYFSWQYIGKGTTFGSDGYIVENFSFNGLYGIPFFIGILGMIYHFIKDWKRAFSIFVLTIMTGIALVIYLNQPDPQPRERDYVYVACFFAFAIWIGIGVLSIMDGIVLVFRQKQKVLNYILGIAILLILTFVPINMFRLNFHSHNRSGNYVPYDYAYDMLESCEKDAILFTNGDNDTFPLWYLQEVENIRKDIRIVNLSLLNTDWYILQLKNQEPKVPITVSDDEIEKLKVGALAMNGQKVIRMIIPPNLVRNYLKEMEGMIQYTNENIEMVFTMVPTILNGKAIRTQDFMIYNIIQSFNFMKPLYFAVTVETSNMIGLKDYLRNDGLACKVIPFKGYPAIPEIVKKNISEKFKYRNLDNPKVYYDNSTISILQNLRKAFLDYIVMEYNNNQPQEALKYLDKMFELIPEDLIPFQIDDLTEQIGKLYYRLGRPKELEKRLDELLKKDIPDDKRFEFAKIYLLNLRNNKKAIDILKGIVERNPQNVEYISTLVTLFEIEKDYKNALNYVDKWISSHPNDNNAIKKKEQLTNILKTSNDTLNAKNPPK
jgi:tetratricopeptide (TPR) repeat protein